MSVLHHSLAKAFGISSVVREKGYYKTIDGMYMIRKTRDPQIPARHQITEHCIQAGYPWMERYYLSQSGQPFVFMDGDYYIMTDLVRFAEADFSNADEFLKIVGSLAHWHSCARGSDTDMPLQASRPSTPLTETMKSQLEALDAIRKKVAKYSKWSDFDVLFLKNYPEYKERITKALKLLESTGYIKRFNKARQMNHICHNGLKEEIFRISCDAVYITKLDFATVDYQLADLCGLIRRKKNYDIDNNRILDVYSKVNPLDPEEEVILEAMLLYPQAFVKIVREYYQKKRSWTPVAMANKMREVLL